MFSLLAKQANIEEPSKQAKQVDGKVGEVTEIINDIDEDGEVTVVPMEAMQVKDKDEDDVLVLSMQKSDEGEKGDNVGENILLEDSAPVPGDDIFDDFDFFEEDKVTANSDSTIAEPTCSKEIVEEKKGKERTHLGAVKRTTPAQSAKMSKAASVSHLSTTPTKTPRDGGGSSSSFDLSRPSPPKKSRSAGSSSSSFDSMLIEDWKVNKYNGFNSPLLDKIFNSTKESMDPVWSQNTPNIGQSLYFHYVDYDLTYVSLLFSTGMFLPQSGHHSPQIGPQIYKSRVPNPSDGLLMAKIAESLGLKHSGGHTMERYGLLIRQAIFERQPGQMYIFDGHEQVLAIDVKVDKPPDDYKVVTDIGLNSPEPYALHSPTISPAERIAYVSKHLSGLIQHKTRLCLALYLSFTDAGTFLEASDYGEEKDLTLSDAMRTDFDSFLAEYTRLLSEKITLRGTTTEVLVCRMITFSPFPICSLLFPSHSLPSHSLPFLPSPSASLSFVFHS